MIAQLIMLMELLVVVDILRRDGVIGWIEHCGCCLLRRWPIDLYLL